MLAPIVIETVNLSPKKDTIFKMGSLEPTPFFEEFAFDGQQNTSPLGFQTSLPFPLALKPSTTSHPTLSESITAIKNEISSGNLFQKIQDHGGALRNNPSFSAPDLRKFKNTD
jgi:hypothetical protein